MSSKGSELAARPLCRSPYRALIVRRTLKCVIGLVTRRGRTIGPTKSVAIRFPSRPLSLSHVRMSKLLCDLVHST